MTRVLRYLLRALIGLLVVLVLLIAGVALYIRTASFNRLLVSEVNQAVQGRFRGQINLGGIRTPHLGVVEIRDVTVTYHGRQLLHVPLIEAGYALIPILWHQIDLTISIDHPELHLAREADGKWDLAEALTSVRPATNTGPSTYAVTITALALSDGTIALAPNGLNQPQYRISEANLAARVALSQAGLQATARKLSAHLEAPNAPPADLTLAAAYDASTQPATITLSSLTLATQNSSLLAQAVIKNLAAPTVDAHVTIVKLSPADLTIIHGYPLRDAIAGSITINGPRNALQAVAALSAGPTRVNLNADADLAGQRPSYHGTLNLAHLDLGRLAIGLKLAGRVDSSIQVSGTGTDPNQIVASVKADARGLVMNQCNAPPISSHELEL